MSKYFITPEYTTAEEIKRVRGLLGITQKEFANLICCSKPTIERWEVSDGRITGPIVLLLQMLEDQVDVIEKMVIPKKSLPIRLWYMYKNKKCTLIDVDEAKQIIKIKNFVDHLQFRAFGINENPSMKDYMEFLESRVFAESRDKLKLILKDLDLPFYDPFLIIEKTQGRMAEDDFWIQIER